MKRKMSDVISFQYPKTTFDSRVHSIKLQFVRQRPYEAIESNER